MTAEDVKSRIDREIAGQSDFPNPHGLDMSRCLLVPTKKRFEDSFAQGDYLSLWLVLEECPDSRDGYKIVYDDERDAFGLAIRGRSSEDVFIGYHGSFLNTVAGM